MAQLEKEQAENELQLKRLKQELHTAQLELNKTASQCKEAQNQIQMLSKEKGKIQFCVCSGTISITSHSELKCLISYTWVLYTKEPL